MADPVGDTSPPESMPASRRPSLLAAFLTVACFTNAALIFTLEPMASKLLLPALGGSPAVWNTCLLFFQAALLAGYAWVHLSGRLLGLRRQALVHVLLAAFATLVLPVTLSRGDPPVDSAAAVAWLLLVLVASIGAPFVMLAGTAPIAQRWLTAEGERDPYFLYAASNLGSLAALLAYPLLVEPLLTLREQARFWSLGYVAGLVILVAAAARVWRGRTGAAGEAASRTDSEPPALRVVGAAQVTARERLRWLVFAAVPSSLLMGVTSYISTDVAAMPLLWVIPLALYLLTFVFAFARREWIPHSFALHFEPHFIIVVSLSLYWAIALRGFLPLLLHLALLFFAAMVCHGELAQSRPHPSRLTEFYLWIAAGGMLGGAFNALAAPLLFDEVREYPLVLIALAVLRPEQRAVTRWSRVFDILLPVAFGAGLAALSWTPSAPPQPKPTAVMAVAAIILFFFRDRPLRFALALAVMLVLGSIRLTTEASGRNVLMSERSFYGVYRVIEDPARTVRLLEHGRTLHGAQSLDPDRRLQPLTYYNPLGPAGDVFTLGAQARLVTRRVGIVGLGVGSLNCFGGAGETWTYHEIDPLVARIATDTTLFTYLRDCPPHTRVVFGDARRTLERLPDASYDILVLDAFSSDAIPVHLMTREAFALYLRVLAPGGVVAVHVSNRHVGLEPVVAAIADEAGLAGRLRLDPARPPDESRTRLDRSPSIWIALARTEDALGLLATEPNWRALARRDGVRAWTDDYSNVLRIIRWR